jgi:hypothetical protein
VAVYDVQPGFIIDDASAVAYRADLQPVLSRLLMNARTHELSDPIETFALWKRLLRPNGRLILMFLNWVYRSTTDMPPVRFTTIVPGSWLGFLNMNWEDNFVNQDSAFPGDARMEWMQIVMENIFTEKVW